MSSGIEQTQNKSSEAVVAMEASQTGGSDSSPRPKTDAPALDENNSHPAALSEHVKTDSPVKEGEHCTN